MKFQKLTIHNIASIENAIIDFEAQPLADSEVFLITGKTGAGKSTILDAICLALYADTPRLNGTKMQGDTKDGDKTVKIDDPRQLMRRNTGEAYVTLTFIGSNGIHYEATWAVARARKKVTGNMQIKDWQLRNLDQDVTLTKSKEIEAEIHAAIGLDFNQFCRTTMLAQGEFTRFLNSKDDEKAEILEKITGVDVYSRIGAKVYAVAGEKEQIWREAQRQVEGMRTLSEEEISARNEVLTALGKEYEELKAKSDKDAAKRDWMKAENDLVKSVAEATDEFRKANEVVDCKEFKTAEALVKDWNATIDARNWLAEIQKTLAAQKKQKEDLIGWQANFAGILGGQKYAEEEIERIDVKIKETDAFLSAESDKAVVYENSQTITGFLESIDEGRHTIEKNRKEVANEKKSLDDVLTPAYEEANSKANAAKDDLAKDEALVKTLEDVVNGLCLSDRRNQRDAAKDLLGKIATAKERIETLGEVKMQYEANRESISDQKVSIEKKTERSRQMGVPIHEAQIKMEVRKEDLDKQKDTIDKFVSTLRLKLHVGDVCPVCRQKIVTELPHEEDLSALVGGLQKAYDDAEKAYKDLVDAKVKLDAEIKTDTKAYDKSKKAFEVDKSVANAEQKAKDACRACGIETLDSATPSVLAELEASTAAKYKALGVKIKEGEDKENEVKKLRKALEKKRAEIETLARKVQDAEKTVNECKARIQRAEALIQSKEDDVANAGQKAGELITSNLWNIDWKASPKEFVSSLNSATKAYNTSKQMRQTLQASLDAAKANHSNVASVVTAILEVMPTWKTTASDSAKVSGLLDKANTIYNKVTLALAQLRNAEEAFVMNEEKLTTFLSEHEVLGRDRLVALGKYTSNDILREDGKLQKGREALAIKKNLLANAEDQLAKHREKKPDLTEDESLEALQIRIADYESALNGIGERRGAVNQELKADKENKARLGALMADADKKKNEYRKWSRMNQLIGDATGNKFRKIAQSYVLTSLIHSANSYMKTLTDRYTLKVTPGTFVISVEDAYQGFVSRTTSTISGGESFLVSLSLALALSDIGQTLSVDTLFIDEGFGTLSGEPLQNAINTLRSLHTKAGRHVGIISHVEELQERISVQIQVNQEGNESSSSINIVPEME